MLTVNLQFDDAGNGPMSALVFSTVLKATKGTHWLLRVVRSHRLCVRQCHLTCKVALSGRNRTGALQTLLIDSPVLPSQRGTCLPLLLELGQCGQTFSTMDI